MALFLSYLEGRRGLRLFDTQWTRLLELEPGAIRDMARGAARRGWLDYKAIGPVVEVRFPGHLTEEEEEWTHESY